MAGASPLLSPSSPLLTPNSQPGSPSCLNESIPLSPIEDGQTFKSGSHTFVHKLYDMIEDVDCHPYICWSNDGTSFVVYNVVEFAKVLLPKHFKHNNFSSFVRQLNMYGFHKINKTPRNQKSMTKDQVWEFSHPQFLRGRPDLLDGIKRKAMDNDMYRREAGDMYGQISMLQVSQADIFKQLSQLQLTVSQLSQQLNQSLTAQSDQANLIKSMMESMTTSGIPVRNSQYDSNAGSYGSGNSPSVYITSPQTSQSITIPQQPSVFQSQSRGMKMNNLVTDNYIQTTLPLSPDTNSFNLACSIPLPPSPMTLSPDSPFSVMSDMQDDGMRTD
ncbi:hypothetical protein K450DRAFT_267363 [Umbelopsis ramanniana AG]|uniref:HSF-type DNA-binding domain-containing protein n=1 Tax=Umbelopsis ramanniana AG TaxID=1314678 RepID=A0AAD5EKL8_UMBRA|nr:uncharacterized protein K450DRAFT_267363 [Umbelopsis ramanniana AG]KAI8584711.1 hypothetical protein K450DRAFT_267363 [Umbelopsis ramanniana AG]